MFIFTSCSDCKHNYYALLYINVNENNSRTSHSDGIKGKWYNQ